jgi:hypothetical protein
MTLFVANESSSRARSRHAGRDLAKQKIFMMLARGVANLFEWGKRAIVRGIGVGGDKDPANS